MTRTFKSIALAAVVGVCGIASADVTITAVNELDIARPSETIEIPWSQIEAALPGVTPQNIDLGTVSQAIDSDGNGSIDLLIFQADFEPKQTKRFTAKIDASPRATPVQSKVYGRFVPERHDDFAWESDKIAFRAYGRKLETIPRETGGSGIDVRVKRGGGLVLDEWYKTYPSGGAHKDVGNGADLYKVGLGRGCGGVAIIDGDTLHYAKGYETHKVIANGPVRFIAELTYAPFDAAGAQVAETKRISIDAGSQLTHYISVFQSEAPQLNVAVGLQKHQDNPGEAAINREQGWMRHWDSADPGPNGNIGVGAVVDPNIISDMREISDHVITVVKVQPGRPFSYYAGAGWDKSGDFPDVKAWDAYLANFAARMKSPVKVTVAGE